MNPASEPPPLPLPPQPHHPSTSCGRHPDEQFTGFCPSCLCERLSVLDQNASSSSTSAPRKPTAAAALRAIFRAPSAAAPSFLPELRRTKSFSASKNTGEGYFSGAFEPQRKSCDVRGRSTLWNLFSQDDDRHPLPPPTISASAAIADALESGRPSLSLSSAVIEDEEIEEEAEPAEMVVRVSNASNLVEERFQVPEIVEERETEAEELFELKPMKDHIDLDSQSKRRDLKEIAGSFWSAASVFSKKLQKWRQKQKLKKRDGGGSATLPVEKPIGRQFRETQSEIADYGFGRRSCDTDPRFSLDAGRISFDDPRYSFDEPRASWDGHLTAGRTFPRMPTMLSVVEDAPRCDAHIPVEEVPAPEEGFPGGSAQTRDYYSDSSTRRPRRSLDRSSSIRKTAQAVVAEMDEMKPSSANAKVTPADHSTSNSNHSNPASLRDEYPELNGKKSRRWTWNIWGLIQRRPDRRPSGVQRSFSDTFGDRTSWRSSSMRADKNKKPFVLERNRSARFSPAPLDNGLLRFYLAPPPRNPAKGRYNQAHSIARSVLRLY